MRKERMMAVDNPLTAEKARSIARWLDSCDAHIKAVMENNPSVSDEERRIVADFFDGHNMQDDLRAYALWCDLADGAIAENTTTERTDET